MSHSINVSVGSLVLLAANSIYPGRRLGLVVDQEAGRAWVKRNRSFIEFELEEDRDPALIRLFGIGLTDAYAEDHYPGLSDEEPRRTVVLNWAYLETVPNPPSIVAGPDAASIEHFLITCRTCEEFGMKGATFFYDVELLLDHLKQVQKGSGDIGIYERRFRAMLAEVLPLRS